jgi:AcrR family transcriptional regulator
VTVREIAEKAGVTHALVHQYVGTKDDLLSAVIQRTNRVAVARQASSLDDALQVIVADMLANRLHSKTMVRSAMDGVEYVSLKKRIETGHALIELARTDAASGAEPKPAPRGLDPRVIVAVVSSLALGWVATEEWNWDVFGIDPSEKDEVFRQIGLIVAYIGDLVLLPGDEPEPQGA